MRAIAHHYREHPDGPHTYGWWDSCPGRAEARQMWLDMLALYRPMVTAGSRVWKDVGPNAILNWRLPPEVVASFFVNEEAYLVLANTGEQAAVVDSRWEWEDRRTGARASRWTLAPRQLLFLRHVVSGGTV